MKKIISVLSAVVACVMLASCGSGAAQQETTATAAATSAPVQITTAPPSHGIDFATKSISLYKISGRNDDGSLKLENIVTVTEAGFLAYIINAAQACDYLDHERVYDDDMKYLLCFDDAGSSIAFFDFEIAYGFVGSGNNYSTDSIPKYISDEMLRNLQKYLDKSEIEY